MDVWYLIENALREIGGYNDDDACKFELDAHSLPSYFNRDEKQATRFLNALKELKKHRGIK